MCGKHRPRTRCCDQADSARRPLRRRLETIERPARVRIRRRKPCTRARRRLLGWKVRLPLATAFSSLYPARLSEPSGRTHFATGLVRRAPGIGWGLSCYWPARSPSCHFGVSFGRSRIADFRRLFEGTDVASPGQTWRLPMHDLHCRPTQPTPGDRNRNEPCGNGAKLLAAEQKTVSFGLGLERRSTTNQGWQNDGRLDDLRRLSPERSRKPSPSG